MINKLLLAVDGSANAQRATDIAGELAAKLNAELFVVHVLMHGRPSAELVHMAEVEHIVKEAHTVVSPGISYVTGSHPELLGGHPDDPRTPRIITAIGDQIVRIAKARCLDQGATTVKTAVRSGELRRRNSDSRRRVWRRNDRRWIARPRDDQKHRSGQRVAKGASSRARYGRHGQVTCPPDA